MHWHGNSHKIKLAHSRLAISILFLGLTLFFQPLSARAEPKSCDTAKISFSPFEPKEFHCWTGKQQSSKLLVGRREVATIELRYSRKPTFIETVPPQNYVSVLGKPIGWRMPGGNAGPIFTFDHGSPNGFTIPMRADGKTAISVLYMKGKDFPDVKVSFEYKAPQQFPEMMLHIVCFVKSEFVQGELK